MTEPKTNPVTREALRTMKLGETRVFEMDSAAAIYSGQSNASQTGKLLGCRFECSADFRRMFLTIKKTAAPCP